jgi:mannan endo-1,6-alpha-mannosidase
MPGLRGNGTWISLAQRTIDEVYDYWSDACGGGIYWVSSIGQFGFGIDAHVATLPVNRSKSGPNLQITQLEFISLATRTYLMTGNATLLHITEELFNWVVDTGMVDLATGIVNDGVDANGCTVPTQQWSYSYGASQPF